MSDSYSELRGVNVGERRCSLHVGSRFRIAAQPDPSSGLCKVPGKLEAMDRLFPGQENEDSAMLHGKVWTGLSVAPVSVRVSL